MEILKRISKVKRCSANQITLSTRCGRSTPFNDCTHNPIRVGLEVLLLDIFIDFLMLRQPAKCPQVYNLLTKFTIEAFRRTIFVAGAMAAFLARFVIP